MAASDLIVPLGITTYSTVLLGVLTGSGVIKVGLRWHKRIAVVAVICATLHADLVIYAEYLW